MEKQTQPEYWQRGFITCVEPLLQPVAHAILQANSEINEAIHDFPDELLWERPAGVASVAFHLQHLSGVLDRLCTYARGEMLSESQFTFLKNEGIYDAAIKVASLLTEFSRQVDKTIVQLEHTDAKLLLEPREVGRKRISSNVLGLLFHAAEHTQRHNGQLQVTARILRAKQL